MPRITRMTWVAGACTIALLALGAGPAQAQFNIDHYVVYRDITPAQTNLPVDLVDQFGPSQGILSSRDKLAAPADKTHPPEIPDIQNILYPQEHLSWWRFQQFRWYEVDVRVGNQFGADQLWHLEGADYLLVPAIKDQVGEIQLNQHYECYYVLDATPLEIPVNLADQFGVHLDVIVEEALYLCNPVEKLGPPPLVPSGPPPFPQDHLACYRILPYWISESRTFQDQVLPPFAGALLEQPEMLCVPSTKTVVEPPTTPSLTPWGIASLGGLMLLTVFWVARQRGRQGGLA